MTEGGAVASFKECRQALEGLRNGIPNRYAVKLLGCEQPQAEAAFHQLLDHCRNSVSNGETAGGMLLAGGFGTGKSHLLEHFQHLATDARFVCSRVVVSKETPLHDPGKVFVAAVENAVVPGCSGPAVKELALKLRPKTMSYAQFYQWAAGPGSGLSALFPATLLIHERLNQDPDLVEDITDFWAGSRLQVASVRLGLRKCNAASAFSVGAVPVRQLALERFAFLGRLILGAGYAGWVLLIDEVELIGRYSRLQRGRSYAELARWLSPGGASGLTSLAAVAAITDDFAINVLADRGDLEYVGPFLRDRGTEQMVALAERAEVGMRAIERDAIHLEPPTSESLVAIYGQLKQIHATAHGWDPPELERPELATTRAMRSYLRRWINEWDLRRIYSAAPLHTVEEELRPGYDEDQLLEGNDSSQEGFPGDASPISITNGGHLPGGASPDGPVHGLSGDS